jgi:Zn-dependent M16 (insulinase) family peptidase
MTATHGFELLRERKLPEINTTARHYRHVKTGAELLSLLNDDENKVFGVTFATPPTDSTGVAHILEHAVLCGSRKYPVKKPFVELRKSSLNTFLNAVTFPDKTCYPVASQNVQDFYNLIDVYLDAVFFPRLTRQTFQQEGWHYELDATDAPLTYKGVVFNEMKGAFSSPDRLLVSLAFRSLYPETTYGFDAGGDPKDIPDLTYEQLKAFHAHHYHPSNAKLFFYGDDDPERRLRLIGDRLSEFSRIDVDFAVPLQPRFSAPRRLTYTYAAGPEQARPDKGETHALRTAARESMIDVSWMIEEITDAETALGLKVLGEILLGSPAAPLYKALVDSGLAEGLTEAGLAEVLRQPAFSVCLKGIDPTDADKIERLIDDTIGKLAADGIDPATVAAALNTVEFRLRESDTDPFPRGIAFMFWALATWMRDRDPLSPLAFEAPLAAVKARVAAGRYFEDLLGRHLVRNRHRITLLLRPDREQGEREAKEEAERLARVRASMTAADLAAIAEETRVLKRMQETPDSPEALAAIPALKLSDMPPRNKLIPIEAMKLGDTRILYHDLFTNGVVYLDLAFDLDRLSADLLPHVDLFGRALLETGAGNEDFVRLSQRIGRSTGGIRATRFSSTTADRKGATSWLVLRGKALPAQTHELIAILRDILTGARLDDRERLRQIVLEEKALLESSLVPAGSSYVDQRLRAGFNEADWADELMGGLSYLFFLRELADQVETDWDRVVAALERIRQMLVDRTAMLANVTTEPAYWAALQPQLADFLATQPLGNVPPSRWQVASLASVARADEPGSGRVSGARTIELARWPLASLASAPRAEGLVVPSKVNFVGKGADLYALGLQPSGANLVVTRYLGTSWLWDKVRLQGGAYGGRCRFDHHSGVFTYLSYRDPNLTATLDIYDRTAEFLNALTLDDAQLTRAIVGTIGDLDFYRLPDAKGYSSMQRYLIGDTDAARRRLRDEVLATTKADFRRFGDVLAQVAANGRVAVLGSEQAMAAANAERPGLLTVKRVM